MATPSASLHLHASNDHATTSMPVPGSSESREPPTAAQTALPFAGLPYWELGQYVGQLSVLSASVAEYESSVLSQALPHSSFKRLLFGGTTDWLHRQEVEFLLKASVAASGRHTALVLTDEEVLYHFSSVRAASLKLQRLTQLEAELFGAMQGAELIFMAINDAEIDNKAGYRGSHWMLACYERRTHTITVYDSLPVSFCGMPRDAEKLQALVHQQCCAALGLDCEPPRLEYCRLGVQEDRSACGWHVVEVANLLLRGACSGPQLCTQQTDASVRASGRWLAQCHLACMLREGCCSAAELPPRGGSMPAECGTGGTAGELSGGVPAVRGC